MNPDDEAADLQPGEVAMWHRRGGLPDNVTEDGDIIGARAGQRAQIAKDELRREIVRLRAVGEPTKVAALARLAASYLLAGDAETARRYIGRAQDLLKAGGG